MALSRLDKFLISLGKFGGGDSIKKIISMLSAFCIVFSLTGCAKLVSTEYQNVEVEIIDEYHRGMYITPIFNGKTTTMITHPATYRITIKYNNVEYDISGRDTYEKYCDKVGQSTVGILEICTYDNGTVKYEIVELKD